MTKTIIYKKDLRDDRPSHVSIENQLRLVDQMQQLTPKYSGHKLLKFKIDWDTSQLEKDIWKSTEQYKWWGWINRNIDTKRKELTKIRLPYEGTDDFVRSSYYGGWSIKYNPTYCHEYNLQPESSGMGELPSPLSWFIYSNFGLQVYKKIEEDHHLHQCSRIAMQYGHHQMLQYLLLHKLITQDDISQIPIKIIDNQSESAYREKDTYFDTWTYTHWTAAATDSGIQNLLQAAPCQVIRSRVAWQRGAWRRYQQDWRTADEYTWHTDEQMVHNLRIVIPIKTSKFFGLEIKGLQPAILDTGCAYTWNSNIIHRQIQVGDTREDRINMILGFNPWFNWHETEQAWISNEFYGKIHPLDMAVEGLIIPQMKFVEEVQ
jgi:hypothetical protein